MLGDTANTHLVEEESARKIRMSEERGRSWALEHGKKKKKNRESKRIVFAQTFTADKRFRWNENKIFIFHL